MFKISHCVARWFVLASVFFGLQAAYAGPIGGVGFFDGPAAASAGVNSDGLPSTLGGQGIGTYGAVSATCWWGQGCYPRTSPNSATGNFLTSTFGVNATFSGFTLVNTTTLDFKYNFYLGSTLLDTLEIRNWKSGDSCSGLVPLDGNTCTTANSVVGVFVSSNAGKDSITALSGGTDVDVTPFLFSPSVYPNTFGWSTGSNDTIAASCTGHLDCGLNIFVLATVPSASTVPEPATLTLFGLAALGLIRRNKASPRAHSA